MYAADSQRIDAPLERERCPGVADRGQAELAAELLLEPQEDAADRVPGPRHTVVVAEDRAGRVRGAVAFRDLERTRGEVHDARERLPLALLGGEDPAADLEIGVPLLDANDLLGAAAGVPADRDEVAERVAGDERQELLELRYGDDGLPTPGLRLLESAER